MTRMHTLILSALCASLVAGCTFMARGPEQYESDTRKVLEERNPQIKACYDALLDREAGIGGNVVVRFTVEKKTGVFKEIRLDNEATTAPESIAQCVLQALQGLTPLGRAFFMVYYGLQRCRRNIHWAVGDSCRARSKARKKAARARWLASGGASPCQSTGSRTASSLRRRRLPCHCRSGERSTMR